MPKRLIDAFNSLAKSQGVALALVLALLGWREWQAYKTQALQNTRIERIESKAEACNSRVLEIYRTDHRAMVRALNRNTFVIEKLTNEK